MFTNLGPTYGDLFCPSGWIVFLFPFISLVIFSCYPILYKLALYRKTKITISCGRFLEACHTYSGKCNWCVCVCVCVCLTYF